MIVKELKQARVQLFRDAANFRKTDRIPHFADVVTWKVFDAGYTPDQAMTNFEVLEETVVKILDRYSVDGLMDWGIRNQFTVTEAFSEGGYYYYDENVVGIHDHAHCTVDTLQEHRRRRMGPQPPENRGHLQSLGRSVNKPNT